MYGRTTLAPNSFPWRYSLAERKWEKKGHAHYRRQDSPEKLKAGAGAISRWIQSLLDNNIAKQMEEGQHMFDVDDDGEEWQMQPICKFEDSLPGNFVLFKFQWIVPQTADTVGTAKAT